MSDQLSGFTVAVTAHRRWEEQAEMLVRRGATVLHAPVMYTSLLHDVDATVEATRKVISDGVDIVVLTTGIGTRSWFGAAESAGLDAALRAEIGASFVIARSPKARSAAIASGVEVDWQAGTETGDEVIAHLAAMDLSGTHIAVQRDGGEPHLARRLVELGATVVDVPVYRCEPPADSTPALRIVESILDDRIDAVTFTSSYAVCSAFALAPDPSELTAALGRRAHAVAVGPVTATTLRDLGIERVVVPQRARLGSMVQSLIGALSAASVRLTHGGHSARLQGDALVHTDGSISSLTFRERHLLTTLVDQAPSVVSKSELASQGADPHAVEAAIGLLRSKLGPLGPGIRTIPRRGYSSALGVVSAMDIGPDV